MNRNKLVALGIVGIVLVAMVLLTVSPGEKQSALQIRAVSSRTDANGNLTIAFMVTNRSSDVFPWFATVPTPDGEVPYYVVEARTEEGWKRTSTPTNHSFTHYLLPNECWEFEASLDALDRPRRLVFFYTVGVRQDQPWIQRQTRELLKDLNLTEDWRELRSEPFQANKIGPANGSQPIRSETNSTSSTAGSRR